MPSIRCCVSSRESLHAIDGHVGVLQRVHVQQHRVAAAAGLEHARHRGGRGAREVAVDEERLPLRLLQAEPGAQRAQLLVDGTGPVAGAPVPDAGAGDGSQRARVALQDGDAVLARVANPREKSASSCARPRLEVDAAVVEDDDRGEPRLKLAQNDAVLDEAVVAAVVDHGQAGHPEGAVRALEATGERRGDTALASGGLSIPVLTSGSIVPMPSGPASASSRTAGRTMSDQPTRGWSVPRRKPRSNCSRSKATR